MLDCRMNSFFRGHGNKSKADFPFLPDLPLHLLEKVINKVDTKTYHRVHQTCREVRDLIENNRNIKLYLSSTYFLDWCTTGDHQFYFCDVEKRSKAGVETFKNSYGLHFKKLSISYFSYFDKKLVLCQDLKKYRITCTQLCIDDEKLTVSQCVIIFNTLRPRKVRLFSNLNQYEAFLQTNKTIRDVTLGLKSSNVVQVTEKLLPKIERLTFFVDTAQLTSEGFHQMILKILKLLQSLKICRHSYFKLYRSKERRIRPQFNEMLGILGAFSPERCGMSWKCTLDNSRRTSCIVTLEEDYGGICYECY